MAVRPAESSPYTDSRKTILARIWERTKQGISVRFLGIRVFLKLRRATPLATNRWLLLRKRLARWVAGERTAAVLDAPNLFRNHRISTPITGVAVVVGVGDGLGSSLVRHLSDSGMVVAALARDRKNLAALMEAKGWSPNRVKLYASDATHQASFENTLECVRSDLGAPNLVIYLVDSAKWALSVDIEPNALEDSWRANCLGAFIVARASARLMTSRGSGTIIFAGATSAIIGRRGYLALATGKFSLRGLAQVFARELWPRGIHVAHVLIDGGSFYFGQERDEPGTDPDAAAKTFLMLHGQAKNAWTHELDLRPWNESFWKHC